MPSSKLEGSSHKTRITCPNCEACYAVPSAFIPDVGREVLCSNCEQSWYFRSAAGNRLTPSAVRHLDRSDLVEAGSTVFCSDEERENTEAQKNRSRDLLATVEIRMIVEGQDAAIRDLANSGRLNATDPKGDTALHLAARTANLAFCELLVDAGADPAALNHEQQTPADVAFAEGHHVAAQLLSSLINSKSHNQECDATHKTVGLEIANSEDSNISIDRDASADRPKVNKSTQHPHAEDAKTTWTDDRVELLKRLWADGWSASQIARELGSTTRNAVLGKAHRLGLLGHQGIRPRDPDHRAFLTAPEIVGPGTTEKPSPQDDLTAVEPVSRTTPGQFCETLHDGGDGTYWTNDRIALLKRLWSENKSAAELAQEFGAVVSSGTVLQKIHSLGLQKNHGEETSAAEEKQNDSPSRYAENATDLSDTAELEIKPRPDTPDTLNDLLNFEAAKEPEDFYGQTVNSPASGTFVAQTGRTSAKTNEHEGDWELDLTPAKIDGDGIVDQAQTAPAHGSENDFLKVRNRGRRSQKRTVVQTGTRLSIDAETCMIWAKEVLSKGWCGFHDIEALISACDGNGDLKELHTNLTRDLEAAGLDCFEQAPPNGMPVWDAKSEVSSDELAKMVEAALNRTTQLPGTQRFVMDKSDELQLLDPMMRAKQELQLAILACEPAVETILCAFESIRNGCRGPNTVSLSPIVPTRPGHAETEKIMAAAECLSSWHANGRFMDGKRRRDALAALETLDLSLDYQKEMIGSVSENCTEHDQISSLEAKISAFELSMDQLVHRHLPYVRRFSCRNVENGEDPEDVFQVAYMGLQRSTQRFKPERGIRFVIYASFWMRQSLTRWRADEASLVRVPVHRHETLAKLDRALGEHDLCFDGVISEEDLAADLEMTVGEIQTLRQIPREVRYPAGPDEWDAILPEPEEENALEQAETTNIIIEALSILNERQQDVILKRFGIGRDSEMTLEEIGQQYGVTRERIRQIEAKALQILSHPTRLRRLQDAMGK